MARSTSTAAEILTIKQVAVYLQVTERTIYRLAAAGGIPAFKVGGSWRFRRGDLDQWIAGRIGKMSAPDGDGMSASANLAANSEHLAVRATNGFAMRDRAK